MSGLNVEAARLLVAWPLRATIPLAILLAAAAMGILGWVYNDRVAERRVDRAAREELQQIMLRRQGTFEFLLREHRLDELKREVTLFGADPSIASAVVIDAEDVIIASSNTELVGVLAASYLDKLAGPLQLGRLRQQVADVRASRVGKMVMGGEREHIIAVYPLDSPPASNSASSGETALILVDRDLTDLKSAALKTVHQQTLLQIVGILLVASVLGIYFHFMVTRRADRIVQKAEQLALGNRGARANLTGGDEIARIGSAFDNMARALAESQTRSQTLLENAPIGIFMATPEGRISYINRLLANLVGCVEVDAPEQSEITKYLHPDDRDWVVASWAELVAGKAAAHDLQYRLIVNGNTLYVHVHAVPVRIGEELLGFMGTVEDITERICAHTAMQVAEERWRLAVDGAGLGVWRMVLPTQEVLWSGRTSILFGMDPAEPVTYERFLALLHPEDRQRVEQASARAIADGSSYETEYRIRRRDGVEVWIAAKGRAYYDLNGNPTHVDGIVLDITEQRHAEMALRESEERYRSVVSAMTEGVLILSPKGQIIASNRAAEQILGLSEDQLGVRTTVDGAWRTIREDGSDFPLDEYPANLVLRDRIPRTGVVMGVHKPDGSLSWIVINAQPLPVGSKGVSPGAVVSFTDITERVELTNRLAASERRLRELFDHANDAIFVVEPQSGRFLDVNQQAIDRYGYMRDEILGMTVTDLGPPGEKWSMADVTNLLRERGGALFERIHRAKDGRLIPVEVSSRLVSIDGEEVVESLARDLTKRKQAEARLRHNEAFLRMAQRLGRIGTWERELDSDRIRVSDELCEIFGIDPAEFDGSEEMVLRRVHPDDRGRLVVRNNGAKSLREVPPVEYRVVRPDGSIRYVWSRRDVFPGVDGVTDRAYGVIFDITERKLAERERERLVAELTARNEEMESFVYTVSHDLKAPMISIGGFTSLLEQDLRSGKTDAALDSLEEVKKAAIQMNKHLNALLVLSRAGRATGDRHAVAIRELISSVTDQLAPKISAVGAHFSIADDLPVLIADPDGMQRVFSNLIDNALTYRRLDIAPEVQIGVERNSAHIRMFVRDNGVGIDPRYQERIFVLFQRLTSDSEGTGVGLAIARRVVEHHGGKIWVESTPGQGSTFWMAFPRSIEASNPVGDAAIEAIQKTKSGVPVSSPSGHSRNHAGGPQYGSRAS